MTVALKGNIAKLRDLERRISDLPRTLALEVAEGCADVISTLARTTFDASQDAFGFPWLPSMAGGTVDLVEGGTLKEGVHYVAIGTKLRARLGPTYAKYQVGLRPIFPRSKLPPAYLAAIDKKAKDIIAAKLEGGA